jgi:hypothetical protein
MIAGAAYIKWSAGHAFEPPEDVNPNLALADW